MLSRLSGALLRAMLIVLVIALPSMVLPGTPADTILMASFLMLCGGVMVFLEYMNEAPSLIEFRDAPPFNRIRFAALFAIVLLTSLEVAHAVAPGDVTSVAHQATQSLGQAMQLPLSPPQLMRLMLPDGTPELLGKVVAHTAGVAYAVAILSVAGFALALRLRDWPAGRKEFNLCTNLPTFDTVARGDVLDRLYRVAQTNLVVGFLLPFVLPALAKFGGGLLDPLKLAAPHSLIWAVTIWAFVPASLLMRGIAMLRLARLVQDQRREAGWGEQPASSGFEIA